ncbi:alpha-L-rhamnosidase N-terminal domain-containing protein [Paenibacillus sp. IB182496]|uniref:Alpha-L-rhamnosidase N-terminal domain-containing protein n=1 Tax=Paenibacillus sabuli TaxID=2772509 RepID=A0A927BP00_9BACL|nr:family 78 glycoside hydrolase catalytic domain [Paenibacillus sabuli]MBD2844061.1 alpha-L-rhamnosidase N-terminal domain-containing protein [Paenibacillus sabuli]
MSRYWKGKWIWAPAQDESGNGSNVYYYFRKEIELKNLSPSYRLYITADTRYRLHINGQPTGSGPAMCVNHYQYYDVIDVTPSIEEGINCIALEVYRLGSIPGPSGLLAELTDADGAVLMSTDDSWRTVKADAWRSDTQFFRMSMYSPFQEHYSSTREPVGWKESGFRDDGWARPRIWSGPVSDSPPAVAPWTRLIERDIPKLIETREYARAIAYMEESIELMNRMRSEDLSIGLSMAGQPLQFTMIHRAEGLLGAEGGDTELRCSVGHLSRELDGIYNPCIVLDFGRSINAYLELDLTAAAGAVIDIGYAERLLNGRFNNAVEGMYADRYEARAGRQKFRSYHWKSFRYIKLMLRSGTEPLMLHRLQAARCRYPYEERGSFHSSDQLLNQVFRICKDTLDLCSNDSIMDTPWREQAQFVGDVSAVTLGGIYACFGDVLLPGKFLRQSAANQLPDGLLPSVTNSLANDSLHPDYSLWWVWGLWQHYRYTGEEQWIHRYYPHVLKVVDAFLGYVNHQGLIEHMPYAVFIDWAHLDRKGVSTPLNALFYGVAGAVEAMAEIKGDAYTRERLRMARSKLKNGFDAVLFCPERECYTDASFEGKQSPRISEQANTSAIYWGLCSRARAQRIFDRLWGEDSLIHTESQPFHTMITLRALMSAGMREQAVALVKDRWGKRMALKGATSTYEEWESNGSRRNGGFTPIMRTQSHAWSAYPAEFLLYGLAGFEILEPGCGKVGVKPFAGAFDYDIVIPLPQGLLRVSRKAGMSEVMAPPLVKVVSSEKGGDARGQQSIQ